MSKTTLATVKKYLPVGAAIEEEKPDSWNNEGVFHVDAPKWKSWKATGTNSITQPYYSDVEGSREDALRGLVDDASQGLEDAEHHTIDAMGWD